MKTTDAFNEADQRIHLLSQIIAKANRTFAPELEDDSHTTLYFDPVSRRIYGRWLQTENGEIIMALDLTKQRYVWFDDAMKPLRKYDFVGKHLVTVERKIDDELFDLGLDSDAFRDDLNFEIPDYPFTREELEPLDGEGVEQWSYYRQLANEAALHFTGHLQADEEIRIWPRQFDTGVYFEQNAEVALSFGFAMTDDMVGEQYFFLSGFHLRSNFNYDDIAKLTAGKWIVGAEWKGAVLPISALQGEAYDNKLNVINVFIREVANWYLS